MPCPPRIADPNTSAGRCMGKMVRIPIRAIWNGIPATARSHDREDNLQAAADKLGRSLRNAWPHRRFRAADRRPRGGAEIHVSPAHSLIHAAPDGDFPRLSRPPSRYVDHARSRGFSFPPRKLARSGTRQPRRFAPPPCRRPSAGNLNRRRASPRPPRTRHRPSRQNEVPRRREVFGLRTDDRRRHLPSSADRNGQDHAAPPAYRLRHRRAEVWRSLIRMGILPKRSWMPSRRTARTMWSCSTRRP